jgi:periplasmic protein TonB
MTETPIFTNLIVSRARPDRPGRDRAAAIVVALTLHLAVLASLVLTPFLFLEMMAPPRALGSDVVFKRPAILAGSPRGDNLPAARVRDGGGGPRETRRPPDSERSRVEPSRTVAQPQRVPVTPPETNPSPAPEVSSELLPGNTIPGAEPGPGLPHGTGTSDTGPSTGCEGCVGSGLQGPGEGPESEDGPLFDWDPRVTSPTLIPSSRALPRYPDLGRRAGLQGTVILMITIGADGKVGTVEVLRAPDQRWGFDLAAIEAVKQWRYHPALMNGRPVAVYAQVMVEFTLSR